MRRTSRRSVSPDRMAAVSSVWIRSLRDTGMAPRAVVRPRGWLALLCAGVLLALRFLALPLHARLLVVLATASLGEDPALLDLLVEAAEGAFERLVLTHSDFGQSRFPSSGFRSRARERAPARAASLVSAICSPGRRAAGV